jgi:hypothetical protein
MKDNPKAHEFSNLQLNRKNVFLKEKNEKQDSAQGSVSLLDNVQSILLISKTV